MKLFYPSDNVKAFIQHYVIVETRDARLNRILPSTSMTMAFRMKGNVAYRTKENLYALPSIVLAGLQKSPRLIQYASDTVNLIVVFKEGTAGVFFKEPLHELSGQSVSLENFISQSDYAIIEEQLMEARHETQCIEVIERFLFSRLQPRNTDTLVSSAIQVIKARHGIVEVKALAKELCLSQDAFEKRFRRVTGTSPKHFATIVRMKTILKQMKESSSFTQLALENGFFDQSHFNKQFKLFTGYTPGDFLKNPAVW